MSISSRNVFYLAVSGFGILLLLMLAAAYLTLRSMDLNGLRPEVIAKVRQLTGRDLRFEGDLRIDLQEGLVIRAEGLALSNADWSSRPWMLTLGDVAAHLALLPLLQGEIRIKWIALRDVDLILETDPAGNHNWSLPFPAGGSGKASADDIPSISIDSGRVTWQTAGQEGAKPLVIAGLQLQADVDVDALRLKASALVKGEKLELSGHIPTRSALAEGRAVDLDLQLRLGDISVTADGKLQRASWGLDPRLELQARQVDLVTLGRFTGRSLPAIPNLDMALRLGREADVWNITELAASSGRSRLQGELQVAMGGQRPRITGELSSEQIDLTELMPRSEAGAGDGSASSPADRGAWLQALERLNGALRVRLARVTAWDTRLENARIDARLDQGRLVLQPVKAAIVGGGHVIGRLEVDGVNNQPHWVLAFESRKIPAGVLLGPRLASLISAPVDLEVDLRTTGSRFQPMTRNLTGEVRLVVGKGTARIKRIDTLVGGVTTLTGQLLSQGSENARLNCAVADFKLQKGVATTEVLLIDSLVSTVRGDGRIDLGAQRIDLTFTPRAKTPTLSVAIPVHVRGPLRKPQFIKDTKATLGKLVGIAGIFVYPPAAVLTLGDLGGMGNPCIELMRGKSTGDKDTAIPAKPPQARHGPLQDLGRGLKKLFGR